MRLIHHPDVCFRPSTGRLGFGGVLFWGGRVSDSMGGGVTKLAEGLREVITDAVQEGLKPVEKRLGGVENRLGGVENRLGGVENRLDGVEKRLDGIEKRLDGIEKEMVRGFKVVTQGFSALGVLDSPAEPKSKSPGGQPSALPMAARDR